MSAAVKVDATGVLGGAHSLQERHDRRRRKVVEQFVLALVLMQQRHRADDRPLYTSSLHARTHAHGTNVNASNQWRGQREFKVGGTSLVSRLSACLTEANWWRLIAE